jgi:hypothetical protein
VKWTRRSGSGFDQQVGHRRKAWPQAVDDTAELSSGRWLVELREDRAHHGRDHAPRGTRHEVLGVAGEVDPAALPGGSEELLEGGLDQACVIVGNDQAHARETALDQAADAGRQALPSSLPAASSSPSTEPQVWIALARERAGVERLDLGIER